MEHLNNTEKKHWAPMSKPSGYKSVDILRLVYASDHDFRVISIKCEKDEITLDKCTV